MRRPVFKVVNAAASSENILNRNMLATSLPVEKPRPETTSFQDFASFHHVTPVNTSSAKVSLINHYVQSLCGLYSRIARQLQVDRSYVSRVARGERRSEPIERALVTEFERITAEDAP
jgi:hypothetical protein